LAPTSRTASPPSAPSETPAAALSHTPAPIQALLPRADLFTGGRARSVCRGPARPRATRPAGPRPLLCGGVVGALHCAAIGLYGLCFLTAYTYRRACGQAYAACMGRQEAQGRSTRAACACPLRSSPATLIFGPVSSRPRLPTFDLSCLYNYLRLPKASSKQTTVLWREPYVRVCHYCWAPPLNGVLCCTAEHTKMHGPWKRGLDL
jgi:hypothetical protein